MEEERKSERWLRMVPKHRILYSFLAVLIFIGLTPLATVAWKLIDINKEALKTSQQQSQLLLAKSFAQKIDTIVDGYRGRMVLITNTIDRSLAGKNIQQVPVSLLEEKLIPFLEQNLVLIRISFLNDRFVEVAAHSNYQKNVTIVQEIKHSVDEAFSSKQPYSDGFIQITGPVFPDFTSKMLFFFSAPLMISGSYEGVLTITADMEDAWNEILTESKDYGYTVYGLDASGNLIAHSDKSKVIQMADLHEIGIVRKFLESKGRGIETSSFVDRIDGRNVRFLGSFGVTKNGWGIFVQVEEKQAYSPVRDIIKSTAIWALGVIALAIIIGIIFAGTISRPIDHLARSSQKFAQGDFSIRADISVKNEIGQLANTFNYMAEELQNYIEKLKEALNENNQLFLGTIRALAAAIDEKDPYTRGHSVRVNKYSVIIAKYMGLSADEIRDIHVSSLLHDVGKIGIDDAILRKPSPLTEEEYEIMKQHPEKGANIMSPIQQMKKIILGMRSHHEKMGGGGYPANLKGDAIPLSARIIHVADTFDAMTTDRPYQKAMSFDKAASRLNEMKGWDCDEKVMEAFNRAYQSGDFKTE